jgi:hypothetical protein
LDIHWFVNRQNILAGDADMAGGNLRNAQPLHSFPIRQAVSKS